MKTNHILLVIGFILATSCSDVDDQSLKSRYESAVVGVFKSSIDGKIDLTNYYYDMNGPQIIDTVNFSTNESNQSKFRQQEIAFIRSIKTLTDKYGPPSIEILWGDDALKKMLEELKSERLKGYPVVIPKSLEAWVELHWRGERKVQSGGKLSYRYNVNFPVRIIDDKIYIPAVEISN